MKKQSEPNNDDDTKRILREIALKIREKRRQVSKNYEKFASENNFNKVTIHRMESGVNFNIISLIEVLNALNISLEDFFTGIK